MFFAHYKNASKEDCSGIYFDHTDGPYCDGWRVFHAETFSPETEIVSMIDFHVHGKTYQEKQSSARDIAIAFQYAIADCSLAYSELATVQDWFCKAGRKYGLLREFRENCIC